MSRPKPILVSLKSAAELLDCSVSRVRQLADEQAIESVYEGRLRKVKYASLESYAANLSRFPTARTG